MDIDFNEIIPDTQDGKKYDPDSSPKAWEDYYRKAYTVEHWSLLDEFDMENPKRYSNEGYSRLRIHLKNNSPKKASGEFWKLFSIGGETDFNFNADKKKKFEKLLDGHGKDLLEECVRSHHTLKNFSLMASTGNMQGVKGANRFDRLDTFVHNLDDYFLGKTAVVLNRSYVNLQPLKNYLSTFTSVYDYCNKVYFIKDKKFVDRIIEEGQQPIGSCSDAIRYMELAKEFWVKKVKGMS
ncbi:MAG: hypothetical protein LBB42_00980 [Coriobacteriales bacterium]|nr:hypothetical protein [Coriobacteriales bacterium]